MLLLLDQESQDTGGTIFEQIHCSPRCSPQYCGDAHYRLRHPARAVN
jgi:hypothetical protein